MTVKFLVHDASGRIKRTGYCDKNDVALQAMLEGESVIQDDGQYNDITHYVDPSGAVQPRAELPSNFDKLTIFGNGTDVATLSGLPVGTVVTVDGASKHQVDDGVFEFTAILPAVYDISVVAWPYFDKAFQIKAT